MSGASADSFSKADSLLVNGAGTTDFSVTVINTGNLSATSGTLAFLGGVTNIGTIDAAAGLVSFKSAVAGTGTLELGATGTLPLLAGAGSGQTIDFLGNTGLLDLTLPLAFTGTIAGFGASDQIDLIKTAETSYSVSGGVLTVMAGTKTVATLNFGSTYTQSDFTLGTDGHGGTFITFA